MTEEQGSFPDIVIRGSGSVRIPGVGDARIAGSGRVSRELIETHGSSRLPGGLKAGRVESHGSTSIAGDLGTRSADFRGSSSIEGSLKSQITESGGSLHVRGDVEGEVLRTSGSAHVGGSIRLSQELRSSGSLHAGGDITAASVTFSGAIDTPGRLDAKSIRGELGSATSRVDSGIQADTVVIRSKSDPFRVSEGELVTPSIQGGEVRLENVTCRDVTGRLVEIGRGCRISGTVHYSESLEVHPSVKLQSEPVKTQNV